VFQVSTPRFRSRSLAGWRREAKDAGRPARVHCRPPPRGPTGRLLDGHGASALGARRHVARSCRPILITPPAAPGAGGQCPAWRPRLVERLPPGPRRTLGIALHDEAAVTETALIDKVLRVQSRSRVDHPEVIRPGRAAFPFLGMRRAKASVSCRTMPPGPRSPVLIRSTVIGKTAIT
jgi:hypothetical protein